MYTHTHTTEPGTLSAAAGGCQTARITWGGPRPIIIYFYYDCYYHVFIVIIIIIIIYHY